MHTYFENIFAYLNNNNQPSHAEAPVQVAVPLPSCPSSEGHWWCTCACPRTSPWHHPAQPKQKSKHLALVQILWLVQINDILLGQSLKMKVIIRFSTNLFNFKLGEKGDEPLEGPLLPVDPEEVHLPQVHHLWLEVICPTVGTLWTCISSSPIPKNFIWLNTSLIWKPI